MDALALSEPAHSVGVDAQNPWPGLAPFTEALKDFFHGRSDEADELLRRVGRKDLTVLFGQSGLGKSSLLQAGLFPRLRREGYLPVAVRLDHAPTAPPLGEQVKSAVSRAVVDVGGRAEDSASLPGETLWEHFHRRNLSLQTADGKPIRLVLMLDQFEELFAIGQASEETRARAARFLVELADLVENRVPKALEERLEESPELARQFAMADRGCRALICLREDYLPHLESLRPTMPSIAENRMRLTRMNGLRALEAVLEPGGSLITPEVARQVVRFVAGAEKHTELPPRANGENHEDEALARMEVEPSILSLVCRELNNRRLAMRLPHITADLLAGNRERILQDYYERCLADQPLAVRVFIEDELVTDSGLRENVALERACKTLALHGAPPSAIDALVKRRLLHLEERLDIQRVELTHDVLTAVVKRSRDQRQQQEGKRKAEQQAAEVREKARRQRRRLRFVVAGMTVALLVVGSFGVASYRLYRVSHDRLRQVEEQKQEAERQQKRADEAEAAANLNFQDSRKTVDEFLTEMSREGLAEIPGLQKLRERFAQEAADRYAVFVTRRPDDLAVTQGYARSLAALGPIAGSVGSVDKAVAAFHKALGIFDQLIERDPTNREYRFQRARAKLDLGLFYWTIHRYSDASSALSSSIAELNPLTSQDKTSVPYALALARAYNVLANCSRDGDTNAEAKRFYELARATAQRQYDAHPDNPECAQALSLPVGNLANLAKGDGEYAKALALENRFLELTELYLRHYPNAPRTLANCGIGYEEKAELLIKLKRPTEAAPCIRAALASYRAAAKENPLVTEYQWMLAKGLRRLAGSLSSQSNFNEAKSLYEEACQILDELTRTVEDRPAYGEDLLQSRLALATFYQGGQASKGDGVTRRKNELRCLDQAVLDARKLSHKYPHYPELNYQVAMALFQRANYDYADGRNKDAIPYFSEGIEVFRSRVSTPQNTPDTSQLAEFLRWVDSAQECAEKAKRFDEVRNFARIAFDIGKGCTTRAGINSLGTVLDRAAKADQQARRYKEAIEGFTRSIELRTPAFKNAPWHWYLRFNMSVAYRDLAQCHGKIGRYREEVLAWREYLRIWLGPMEGMKVQAYLAPGRPANEAEAVQLRKFVESAPAMKTFTVQADFSGLMYPFQVYITNVPWPKDPLEDQARWLQEERGGTVPENVRQSFRKLQKIAYENNVSFIDLCAYAFRSTTVSANTKATLTQKKNKILGQLATLSQKNKQDPSNLATQTAVAGAYEELAATHKSLREMKDAIQAAEHARQLFEAVYRARPDTAGLERLIQVDFVLGELYADYDVNRYADAYTAYQRSLDLLDELANHADGTLDRRAEAIKRLDDLGYLCGKAYTAAEGARWYLKAVALKEYAAAKSLASLYLEHKEIAPVVPEPIRNLLVQAAQKTKSDPRTFPVTFADSLQLNGPSSFLEMAAWYTRGISKTDRAQASYFGFIGHKKRGELAFYDHRYAQALADLKDASEAPSADALTFEDLGMCYGKLNRWDEAVKAYTRSIDLDTKHERTSVVMNFLEALICAERPEQMLNFLQTLDQRSWKLPKEGTPAAKYNAMYYGLRAIALRATGKDASEAERQMRQITREPGYKITGWTWDELDGWLQRTKLPPNRKAAAAKIIAELKGTGVPKKTAPKNGQ